MIWKLAVSLPANLLVFWFVLRDNYFEVVLFGMISGVAGAFLLTALDSPRSTAVQPAAEPALNREATESEVPMSSQAWSA